MVEREKKQEARNKKQETRSKRVFNGVLALVSWLYLSSKEAKSFSLAPMGAAPRKADSGNTVQKMPKSGAPENKKIVLCNIP